MKIWIVQGESAKTPGRPISVWVSDVKANEKAAELTNIILKELDLKFRASPTTWSDQLQAAREAVDMDDDNAFGVWIVGTEIEPKDARLLAVDDREQATMLAALSFWGRTQAHCLDDGSHPLPEDVTATMGGTLKPLSRSECGALFDRLIADAG